ncbi:MAG: ParB N-terminal domain-containing protein [Alphaproteobacteria bacterium]|nr:ParB N-terminal domain-containing protein [Alphaproteobacteria bacterium]
MAENRKRRPVKDKIEMGFDTDTIDLRIDQIISLKMVTEAARASRKFRQIVASIREVGIIEPPVVTPDKQNKGRYILLDGHLRIEALKQIGETEVTCLVSKDDEAFTYNKHISRLTSVQEHRMIVQAVNRGVSEEKIAQALDVNLANIVRKRNLLDGICDEAAELLKDKDVAGSVFRVMKRMIPVRQIEVATLMNDARIYSGSYAKALLAATPKKQLLNPQKPKNIKGLSEDQMARMEDEMAKLQREHQLVKESYGVDNLNLMLAKGYLGTLLGNAKVVRYLTQHHPEILKQFQKISEMTSLGGKEAA